MGQLSVGGVAAIFRPVLKLLTASGTYTIPYAGWYRIAAVGHGGQGVYSTSWNIFSPGGAGGMGYVDKYLAAGTVLTATITDAISKVAVGNSNLISATAGNSSISSRADAKCRAGTVSGDGVVAAPSNGTLTSDITPPDAYNDPMYISPGGWRGLYETGTSQVDDRERQKSGGNGLFGGPGGNGGDSLYKSPSRAEAAGWAGDRGGASGTDAGATSYDRTVYSYSGAGGGAGYGGGGGAPQESRYYAGSYFAVDDGAAGGAGCVRIERIR